MSKLFTASEARALVAERKLVIKVEEQLESARLDNLAENEYYGPAYKKIEEATKKCQNSTTLYYTPTEKGICDRIKTKLETDGYIVKPEYLRHSKGHYVSNPYRLHVSWYLYV